MIYPCSGDEDSREVMAERYPPCPPSTLAQKAIVMLVGLGVARVLTSGQNRGVPQGLGLICELVEAAGGRISITDIVSGRQLTQSIVNDPKLWAS